MTARGDFRSQVGGAGEKGVVLIVTLIILLLVTLVVFAAARGSTMDLKLASTAQQKVATFQAAEAAVLRVTESIANLGEPSRDATPVVNSYDFAANAQTGLKVSTTQSFTAEAAAPGYSIRKGSAGFRTLFYDVEARATTVPETGIQTVCLLSL